MFPKETLEYLGYLLYPQVPNWGADFVAYCLFHPLERILEINDKNYLNHISYHTKQVPTDAVGERIGAIFNSKKMRYEHNTDRIIGEEIPLIRKQVAQYIQDFHYLENNKKREEENERMV